MWQVAKPALDVDTMWGQCMLQFLKSGCILGDRWSSEQLGTMRFGKVQEMRDVFAGVLLALAADGQPQAHCFFFF